MIPVNSTAPQVVQDMRALAMEFNENVFEVLNVQVQFSSNCTDSVTVSYSNPLLLTIPDTGANTGQCQYIIQLVDSNAQQIGYPVVGFFVAEGTGKNMEIVVCHVYLNTYIHNIIHCKGGESFQKVDGEGSAFM